MSRGNFLTINIFQNLSLIIISRNYWQNLTEVLKNPKAVNIVILILSILIGLAIFGLLLNFIRFIFRLAISKKQKYSVVG